MFELGQTALIFGSGVIVGGVAGIVIMLGLAKLVRGINSFHF